MAEKGLEKNYQVLWTLTLNNLCDLSFSLLLETPLLYANPIVVTGITKLGDSQLVVYPAYNTLGCVENNSPSVRTYAYKGNDGLSVNWIT